MSIAIIPARGGSKRIPRKNIREFHGHPMIGYAISSAFESGLFDHVVVSTDDIEIANTAKSLGAEVPFLRPGELADDDTPTVPVIAQAIDTLKNIGWVSDFICCIYPAVPLLHTDDLAASLHLLKQSGSEYAFPVSEFPSPPQRALKLKQGNVTESIWPVFENSRTQDLETAYFDCGQFYWGRTGAWTGQVDIHNNAVGYPIPQWRVVDIDTPEDWLRAEKLFQINSRNNNGKIQD